ncbi:MAG: cytochrome c biogenesis protein DipZ [Candidatus Dormibacteraceae bacterium]
MILFVLVYLGGVLTIVSPCILPVLPFVFTRADRPFVRGGLPLLVGMAATFAAVATLAAVGGGWAVQANQDGRGVAMGLLALFGVALLFPGLTAHVTRPLVTLGARLSQSADHRPRNGGSTVPASILLGIATGLLWAPCAGPILGLILTGAAIQGANGRTSLLLLTYAAGAATSLALALLLGGRVYTSLKRSLGVGEWVRKAVGVAVLAAVAAIALGLDTGVLTQVSLASTAPLEQGLLDTFQSPHATAGHSPSSIAMTGGNPSAMLKATPAGQAKDLAVEGSLPSLSGAVEWLNSPPLTAAQLKGKVVLVDFWTYSCINCLREVPYVLAWAAKYANQGLIVIGVHAPEFAFEKNIDNVRMAVSDLKIGYPVAVDNNYAIWRAFSNEYWRSQYFVVAKGKIRFHNFGEGVYEGSERVIQQLLADAGATTVPTGFVSDQATGVEAAPDLTDLQSPETYLGYERAANFVSPGGAVQDSDHVYTVGTPRLNEWGVAGDWMIGAEQAELDQQGGRIVYRFHARDLNLVLGPGPDGKSVRFTVTIDRAAPGNSHGTDVDAAGQGIVSQQRLYQLIRQSDPIGDHTFEIRFLDPGVQAYAFTVG